MRAPKYNPITALTAVGISYDDAAALRRVSMTLRRWFERECGDVNGCAIERDEATGIPYETYNLGGNDGKRGRTKIADREAGAMKRLNTILKRYPTLGFYVQSDPRGAALYILRPGDVPAGETPDAYYSRGIVCE